MEYRLAKKKEKMRAIVFKELLRAQVMNVSVPNLGAHDVMVKTGVSSISPGTEMALYKGIPSLIVRGVKYHYPLIPSYTATGKVIQVGSNVRNVKIGDRVYTAGTPGPYGKIYSMWGGHVEYAITPADRVSLVPAKVSNEEATFLGVIQAAMNGIITSEVKLGDTIVIIGQGLVGLCATQLALCAGARQVIVVDLIEERLHKAKELGAHFTINPKKEDCISKVLSITKNRGADIVLDCAGSSTAFRQAFEMVRELGVVDIVATYWHEEPLLPFDKMSAKQVQLKLAGISPIRYRIDLPPPYNQWQYKWVRKLALDLIAQGRVKIKSLITHSLSVYEAPKAYKIMGKDPKMLGVVINWE